MFFASRGTGEGHVRLLEPRSFAGPLRPHEPIGGTVRSEAQLFRLLDIVSYLHARRGLVTREEIAFALPGWSGRSDALERQFYRCLTALQTTLGLALETASEPGAPAAYRLARRYSSPLLSFACGRGEAPTSLAAIPDRNWTTTNSLHAVCGILRTLAFTSRERLLRPADLEAQWPLTPALLQQFLRRWEARSDFGLDHHHALRLLWVGRHFRLSTRWPLALQRQRSVDSCRTFTEREAA
jgi:hypothetical protein